MDAVKETIADVSSEGLRASARNISCCLFHGVHYPHKHSVDTPVCLSTIVCWSKQAGGWVQSCTVGPTFSFWTTASCIVFIWASCCQSAYVKKKEDIRVAGLQKYKISFKDQVLKNQIAMEKDWRGFYTPLPPKFWIRPPHVYPGLQRFVALGAHPQSPSSPRARHL